MVEGARLKRWQNVLSVVASDTGSDDCRELFETSLQGE